jgi:molecular chaperone GrpE (heat shock protein)
MSDSSENFTDRREGAGRRHGAEAAPQFGLIDVIEAFTALRHEYRSQIKETRALSEQLEKTANRILGLESELSAAGRSSANGQAEESGQSERFAAALMELDIQLSRAVDAALVEEEFQQSRRKARSEAFERSINGLSRFARWSARPIIETIRQQEEIDRETSSTVAQGLAILKAKLQETLQDYDIERIETYGTPFDAELMKSFGVVSDQGLPSGHVFQQLSPAYVRNGKVLRFAEVRVTS